MFAVIDCGTTMTRIYIVDENQQIIASGRKKVGVRDTSITGSRDTLRSGVTELFFEVLEENRIPDKQVEFAIASGMITSEVGLIEIPHLVAPVGLHQLSGLFCAGRAQPLSGKCACPGSAPSGFYAGRGGPVHWHYA